MQVCVGTHVQGRHASLESDSLCTHSPKFSATLRQCQTRHTDIRATCGNQCTRRAHTVPRLPVGPRDLRNGHEVPRHGAGTLHIIFSWRSWALMRDGGGSRPLALRCQGRVSASAQAWGACSVGSHCRPAAWVSTGTTGSGCFFPYAFGRGKARSERQAINMETKPGEFTGHPGLSHCVHLSPRPEGQLRATLQVTPSPDQETHRLQAASLLLKVSMKHQRPHTQGPMPCDSITVKGPKQVCPQ